MINHYKLSDIYVQSKMFTKKLYKYTIFYQKYLFFLDFIDGNNVVGLTNNIHSIIV